MSVGRLLEEGHYTRQRLNEDVSKKFLQTYLELLDFSHLFFTQKDVDGLNAKYGNSIAGDVLLGTLKPAYEIYDLYSKRVDERVAKIKELLKQPTDFKSDTTIELSRQKSPWPKDEAEADQLWRGRIANELLQEKLSEHPIEPAPQLVGRRYDRLARNVHEQDKNEQMKLFLDALAQTYDPHSEYLSKADMKNFSINMGLSLVGIGAMLRSEDGYAKIENLVPGGPAQVDGRLKVGDRISAVAQGQNEFVDVREMRLDKVVEMQKKRLMDPNQPERSRAAALGMLRSQGANKADDIVEAGLALLAGATEPNIRALILRNLRGAENTRVIPSLLGLLKSDPDEDVRDEAARTSGEYVAQAEVRTALEQAASQDASEKVKRTASAVLAAPAKK